MSASRYRREVVDGRTSLHCIRFDEITHCVSCAKRRAIRRHYSKNKAAYGASRILRRAKQRQATPFWYGEFDDLVVREAFSLCAERREATGIDWHVDHMVPLQAREACGLHCGINLQVIPGALNSTKNNKMIMCNPDEWLGYMR